VPHARKYFVPIADWLISEQAKSSEATLVIGIYGAQGSGKSTLADLLARYLRLSKATSVVSISIDDFYLTREERLRLSRAVHPLLATRGPPGTHDVVLAVDTLLRLKTLQKTESLAIPKFDKASDDRAPQQEWPQVSGPVDLVIFEGWCLGCRAESRQALIPPINELERLEDEDGIWRRFVNDSILRYRELFRIVDRLIVLQTLNFESVVRWRKEQEHKLRQKSEASDTGVMEDAEIDRFVQLFERVSRSTERDVGYEADVVFVQDDERRICSVEYR